MWGSLGDIVFQALVTPDKESFKRKASFNYAEIKTFQKPKLQKLGNNLQTIEFELLLVKTGNIDPVEELEKLYEEADRKEPLTLVVGDYIEGDFVIEEIEEILRTTDRNGNPASIKVKVKLKEYN